MLFRKKVTPNVSFILSCLSLSENYFRYPYIRQRLIVWSCEVSIEQTGQNWVKLARDSQNGSSYPTYDLVKWCTKANYLGLINTWMQSISTQNESNFWVN